MSTAICSGGAAVRLPDAGLQDVELARLDGELDVAHVAVVLLERGMNTSSSCAAHSGNVVGELGQVLGVADAGDDVLALGVDQEVAVGCGSPVEGSRVNATPVPRLAQCCRTPSCCTLTAVPRSSGCPPSGGSPGRACRSRTGTRPRRPGAAARTGPGNGWSPACSAMSDLEGRGRRAASRRRASPRRSRRRRPRPRPARRRTLVGDAEDDAAEQLDEAAVGVRGEVGVPGALARPSTSRRHAEVRGRCPSSPASRTWRRTGRTAAVVKPGGTGRPILVISARFAPLPPRRSR
jgi:hypothetical protein